jgi:hypothetical protein
MVTSRARRDERDRREVDASPACSCWAAVHGLFHHTVKSEKGRLHRVSQTVVTQRSDGIRLEKIGFCTLLDILLIYYGLGDSELSSLPQFIGGLTFLSFSLYKCVDIQI